MLGTSSGRRQGFSREHARGIKDWHATRLHIQHDQSRMYIRFLHPSSCLAQRSLKYPSLEG